MSVVPDVLHMRLRIGWLFWNVYHSSARSDESEVRILQALARLGIRKKKLDYLKFLGSEMDKIFADIEREQSLLLEVIPLDAEAKALWKVPI